MAHYRIGEDLYDMDPTTWPNVDVSSVQRQLGCGLSAFMERIEEMDVDAIQAVIWVLRRRSEPGLKIDDVTFTLREFTESIEISDSDVREGWPRLDAMQREELRGQLTDEQRERLFDDAGDLVAEAVPLDSSSDTAT